jgi:glycerophosphoryl diester phosphodiesterase
MRRTETNPLIIAHRGFHDTVPENTMEAFAKAAQFGFDGIETDVQLDRTGTPILYHDTTLPDGTPVQNLNRRDLSDAVGYNVPQLEQALQDITLPIWNIEIKSVAAIKPTANILKNFIGIRKIILSSFWHAAVKILARELKLPCALLVAHCPDGPLLETLPLKTEVDSIVWDAETVDAAALDWATSVGMKNLVYSYRPTRKHAWLLDKEIYAIITDFSEAVDM